jgi:RHS repeat-associated protein
VSRRAGAEPPNPAYVYNYFRTYDPTTGRYLESDAIGLQGGLNTYGYVGGDPLSSNDPYGLIKWEGDFEIGALSGGVGVARVVFNLESECVAGKKVRIRDWVFWAFQTDYGLPLGAVRGSVRLEDGLSSLNADNLNHQNLEGDFSATSIGPTVGPFGLPVGIDLGKASGLAHVSGFDIGWIAQATAGKLKIPRGKVRYEECECTQ